MPQIIIFPLDYNFFFNPKQFFSAVPEPVGLKYDSHFSIIIIIQDSTTKTLMAIQHP